MTNRSTGAFVKTQHVEFAIVIRMPAHEVDGCRIPAGSHMETVKRAPTKRIAIGMAMRGLPQGSKVVMCKTASELTYDERGRYGMETTEDRIRGSRSAAQRRAEFNHNADLF